MKSIIIRFLIFFVCLLLPLQVLGTDLPTVQTLQNRLAAEVQEMIDAGHLAPAICYCEQHYVAHTGTGAHWAWDDYWHNPGDLVYALSIAIPHLPTGMQSAAMQYLEDEFDAYPPYTYVHMGTSGVHRSYNGVPTEYASNWGGWYGVQTSASTTVPSGQGFTFYPFNIYACYKFAQLFPSRVNEILTAVQSKVVQMPDDTPLYEANPHIVNMYIAGYYGYQGLRQLAGLGPDSTVQGWLNNALSLRVQILNYDPAVLEGFEAGGFCWLVPELGQYLRNNALTRVQEILAYEDWARPYWYIARAQECTRYYSLRTFMEGYHAPIYDYFSLFAARAHILKLDQQELEEYLDAPAVWRGDLYYIQNIVHTINAYGNKQILAGTGQATMHKDSVNVAAMVNEAVAEARNSYGTGKPKVVLVSESIDATGDTVLNAIKTEFGNDVIICGVHINANNYRPMTIETFPLLNYRSIAIMALGNEIDVQTGKADGYDAADTAAQRATGVALGAQFTPDPQRKNLLLVMGAQHAGGVVNTVQGLRDSLSGGGPFPNHLNGFGWGTMEHNDHVYYNSVRYFNTNPNASVVGVMITGDFEWAFSGQAQTGEPAGSPPHTGWANALAESTVHVNNIVDELGGVPDATFYAPAHPNEANFEPMRAAAESILGSGAPLFGWHAASETGHDTTNSDILGTTYHFFVAGIRGDVEVDNDITPPNPDPLTWATVPYATGQTSVSMTATTAADPSGVEYYFECTAGTGGHDSGWQNGTTYVDTALSPGTQYTYRAKARDRSGNQNETGWSPEGSATTLTPDTTPPDPDPLTWASAPAATGSNSVIMTASTASDASDVEYCFECTAGGGNNSSWQNSSTYEDTGLVPGTQYTYRAKARDKSSNHNETGWTSELSATTDPPDLTPPTPDPLTWASVPNGVSETAISMTAATAADAGGVEYYFECTAGGGNNSLWQNSPAYTDTGLTPDTQYTYRAKARDKSANQNETGWTGEVQAGTYPLDLTPPTPDPLTWAQEPNATGQVSISMTATTAADISGVEYYFECTAGAGHSSNWQAGAGYLDMGLQPDTQYTYRVKARDKSLNQNETGWSSELSATTEPITGPELVGWWKFDETSGTSASDSSGSGNNGTFVDTPAWTSPGKIGGALSFDGVDDNIDVLPENRIANLPTGDFTVAWWMNWNQDPAQLFDTIMGKYGHNGTASAGWEIYLAQDVRRLNVSILFDGTGMLYRSSNNTIPANTWVHMAVVFQVAGKTAKIYVDGIEQGYVTQTPGSGNYKTDSGIRTQFGRAHWSSNYFRGMLDDIRIYATALTELEIQTLMSSVPSPADFNDDGVVNVLDLALMAQQWLAAADPGTLQADILINGCVDFADFAKLAEGWLD